MDGRSVRLGGAEVKSSTRQSSTRRLVFPLLPPFRGRNPSRPRLRARRSQPILDPICVLGEQRNHEAEGLDLPPHALNLRLLLLQNLVRVLHGYLPAPHCWTHAFERSNRMKPYWRTALSYSVFQRDGSVPWVAEALAVLGHFLANRNP